jgi:hypothetical protein
VGVSFDIKKACGKPYRYQKTQYLKKVLEKSNR